MKASEELIGKIKEWEGYEAKAYKCPAGVWTCGHGHTKGVTAKTTCTRAQADKWLREDLAPIEKHLTGTKGLTKQCQADAVMDFCFNLGTGNWDNSTLKKKIESGATEKEIRAEFMRWVYGGGKRLKGLEKRRRWEADKYFER